ncbi:MAG: WD40 repeat domain-containing protein, partial [Bacteroidetes bacterium]|nr:WD40 repeat domain-containing protein [Bacteroidota bacterium]
MKRILKYFFFFCALATSSSLFCQNENTKWYFGNRCALDFITNPPTPLNNSAMNTDEGCSSIADGAGNLLFYTDGITVYDASHSTMANGTGLNGSFSSAQSAIILKQPGSSTIYYIFTMAVANSATGLCYSIVDMSLAAGMGSVTVKNVSLNSGISQEKLTATKHANGSDYWIMTQELTTSDYKAYLLTAMGINTIAIVSSMGPTSPNVGYIKFAPNGQKFANAFYGSSNTLLYDFNKTTGVLSNSLNLNVSAYGCEFSPDGTKLYASNFSNSSIMQWDLSAGSNTAILASAYTVTNSVTGWAMQLAPNQKIYITAQNTTSIHVINNPNVAGVGCNFVASAQVVGISNFSSHVTRGLPTMIAYHSCPTFTTTHTAPLCSGLNTGTAAITAVTGTLGGVTYTWSNGINTYTTPSVNNLSAGQWSVTLTNTIGCTSQSVFTINQPPAITVNIASSSPTACANNSVTLNANALGGVGGFNYAWQGTANGNTA